MCCDTKLYIDERKCTEQKLRDNLRAKENLLEVTATFADDCLTIPAAERPFRDVNFDLPLFGMVQIFITRSKQK